MRYVFSKIPTQEPISITTLSGEVVEISGAELIKVMRSFFNSETYRMRIRGQHLLECLKPNGGWKTRTRGQPVSESKYHRVYIDTPV